MSKVLPILFALLFQQKAAPQKEKAPPPVYMPFDDGDKVSANLKRPDEQDVTIRSTKRPGNLHGVRAHFVREMVKSAENVD